MPRGGIWLPSYFIYYFSRHSEKTENLAISVDFRLIQNLVYICIHDVEKIYPTCNLLSSNIFLVSSSLLLVLQQKMNF